MTKPDNSISFEDIMDVFSAVEPKLAPAKEAEVKVTANPEKEIEIKKPEPASQEQPYTPPPLPEPVYEPAPAETLPAPEIAQSPGTPQAGALFAAYNEAARLIRQSLLSFVNEKAVNHMMLGSLEKTALNYPVLKGTNWDKNEKLHEDGSVDVETAERNALKDQASAVESSCEALSYLTYMRLKAVKTGAGKERYEQVKAALLKGLEAATAGFSGAAAWHVKNKVIIPAIKRGDDAQ